MKTFLEKYNDDYEAKALRFWKTKWISNKRIYKAFYKTKVIPLAWEISIQTLNKDFSLLKIFLNIFLNIYEIIMSTNITNFVFNLK